MTGVRVEILIALAWLIGSGPVAADTIRETLEAFGFSGTWALNCNQPASPDNNVRIISVSPAGDPIFTESLGFEPNIYVILRAHIEGDSIALRTKLNGEIEQDLTMRKREDRLRTMSNRDVASGRYVVRDGLVLSNKQETPWLTHCAR